MSAKSSPAGLIWTITVVSLLFIGALLGAWYWHGVYSNPELNGSRAVLETTTTPAGTLYTIRHDNHDWVVGYNIGIIHHPDCRCCRHYPDDRWRGDQQGADEQRDSGAADPYGDLPSEEIDEHL